MFGRIGLARAYEAARPSLGRYDRRDHRVQRKAATQLRVPYITPEG
jgi:hypothetical protein